MRSSPSPQITDATSVVAVLYAFGFDRIGVVASDLYFLDLRRAAPEIVAAVHRLLDGVRAGELARPPADEVASARASWL